MHDAALDLIPVGYFILDEAGHIEDVNATGAETVCADVDDLVGLSFSDLVLTQDTWRFLKHLRTAARSGDREQVRVELRCPDGTTFLADLFTQAEKEDGREVVRFHTSIVTAAAELIEAKEEAEQISRLKTAFVANMSHEIRTPLTGIIGFATVLAKELPDEHREFAQLIQESGRRLLEMLNSVLDLAKLESDAMSISKQHVKLADETRKVADLLRPLAREKGLEVRVEREGEEGHLITDRAALNRILHNLIGNAIKFTDRGSVTIRVRRSNDRVVCDVVDTGIGIDPQFVPHLFEEFRQESYGTDRSHPGTGLGLTITKRLVELLDGEISVDSRKGEGSIFSLSFPSAAEPSTNGTEEAKAERIDLRPSRSAASAPHKILLVEDNSDTQHLLTELLEERYDVAVVGDASEAFLAAFRMQFDLILMDIHLGHGPDGVELLKQLRDVPEYKETPIVALTAYALPGDRERFLELGFTEYISKPFDVDELLKLPQQLG